MTETNYFANDEKNNLWFAGPYCCNRRTELPLIGNKCIDVEGGAGAGAIIYSGQAPDQSLLSNF